ncbi:hypothetical protein [Paenibacillus dokdonensis]|uniref:hypothetical protein n=1 Tax=Paenibacillus dokdonensis TaxID=2567944 RepID=UPI001457D61E|nr:hypothetical protein [Paenibacillus dokdonensis]
MIGKSNIERDLRDRLEHENEYKELENMLILESNLSKARISKKSLVEISRVTRLLP